MPTPSTSRTDAKVTAAPALLAGHILADAAAQTFGPDAIAVLGSIAERNAPEANSDERAFLALALELCIEAAILRIREARP